MHRDTPVDIARSLRPVAGLRPVLEHRAPRGSPDSESNQAVRSAPRAQLPLVVVYLGPAVARESHRTVVTSIYNMLETAQLLLVHFLFRSSTSISFVATRNTANKSVPRVSTLDVEPKKISGFRIDQFFFDFVRTVSRSDRKLRI